MCWNLKDEFPESSITNSGGAKIGGDDDVQCKSLEMYFGMMFMVAARERRW